MASVKERQVTAIGIRDHRSVTSFECATHELANRRRFARPRGAYELEVFGFIERSQRDASERQRLSAMSPPA